VSHSSYTRLCSSLNARLHARRVVLTLESELGALVLVVKRILITEHVLAHLGEPEIKHRHRSVTISASFDSLSFLLT